MYTGYQHQNPNEGSCEDGQRMMYNARLCRLLIPSPYKKLKLIA